MRIVTKEEMQSEPWRGRGNSSKVFRAIVNLQPGQLLFIEPGDWGSRKYPPSQVVRYIAKNYNRKYEFLRHAGGKGWRVKRIL
jgi:hypothetical protein